MWRFKQRMISALDLPCLVRRSTSVWVGPCQAIRPTAIRYNARFASWLPPRFSRWRVVLPDAAGIGATPHSCAKAASLRSRSGLSPAATSSTAAVWVPTPLTATSAGAAMATSRSSWVSRAVISWVSRSQRRAIDRSASLAASVGVAGLAAARRRAAVVTSSAGGRRRSWARSRSGAVTSSALSWLAAWVGGLGRRAARQPQRTDHLHLAVGGLGLPGRGAGLDRPGGRDRVQVVGLALASPGGPVGPVDLDDQLAVARSQRASPAP